MDPFTTSALIGAGAQIIGGFVNRWKDKRDQKDMLQYQNAINQANWSMQNEYNSPVLQMQRLKNAGLNPNLIYQQGGAVTQSGEIASPSGTSFSTPVIPDSPLGQFQDYLQYDMQGKQLEVQKQSVENQNSYYQAQNALLDREKEMMEIELKFKDRLLYQDLLSKKFNNLVLQETANKLQAETQLTRRDIDTYYIRLQNTLDDSRVQRMIGRAGIKKIESEIAQINTLMKKTDNEAQLLALEYVRGTIAKKIEEYKQQWLTDSSLLSDDQKKQNMGKQLENEMELIEKEILGKSINNISNPIRDILFPVAAYFVLKGRKMQPIGFK